MKELDEFIIKSPSTGIFATDKKGRILSSNQTFFNLLGIEEDNKKKVNVLEIDSVINSELYEVFQKTLQGEKVEAGPIYTSLKGRELYLNVKTAPKFRRGKIIGLIGIIEDITEKAKLEWDIKKLADITNASADAIIGLGVFGRIESWNRGAEEIFGYKKEEILEAEFNKLVPEGYEKEVQGIWREILKSGSVRNVETYQQHKEGRLIPVNLTATALKDRHGNVAGVSIVMKDLTEKKKAEEQLMEYSKKLEDSNRLKDLFTDIMRHDLLNPVSIIKGVSEFLVADKSSNTHEEMEIIHRNTLKLEQMIESASKLAKVESVEKIELDKQDLNAILKKAVDSFEPMLKEKGMQLGYEAEGEYFARANPVIEDVFSNLISNAVKYSPEKSKIVVGVEDGNDKWRVMVKDWGEGVPDESKEVIFERFKRADKRGVKGTGLGLAIAKRIIELHSGKIWVEDNPEGGSIFYVTVAKYGNSK